MEENHAMFDITLLKANFIFNLANIALIVGAVLVAIGTITAIWAGGIRDRFADERTQANEARTAIAREEAARANENTEKLKESNLILQAAADRERAERLKLEARIAPRRLSTDATATMSAKARELCPRIRNVPVTAAGGNNEAQTYGTDFVMIFRDAGCTSDLALPIPGLRPEVQGVHIGVRDIANIPPEAHLLGEILTAGKVAYTINPMPPEFFAGERLVLIVGAKANELRR
ncbi:hypothetical protein R69776_06580 [Paraburkholderia nemoris]|uniref:Uncharacterized protein n=2 Tax=Paraburkholderia nemoris TaxID=2793076 RepID=A0ABM8STN0_9BURK|nr:hypothetical protein R69776_06580 [Paraburkholderia nemoris]CAE6846231.1 hypothetical protein R75777_07318 [Paraburkholderia nemoris]